MSAKVPAPSGRAPEPFARISRMPTRPFVTASWACLLAGACFGMGATPAWGKQDLGSGTTGASGAAVVAQDSSAAGLKEDVGYVSFTQKHQVYNNGSSTDRIYIGDTSGARNFWSPEVAVQGNRGLLFTCHYPLDGSHYLNDTYATRDVPPSTGPYPAYDLYVDNDDFTADDLRAVLYFGYGGPAYDRSLWPEKDFFDNVNWSPIPDKRLYAYSAMLVSYVYTGDWEHFDIYNGARFYKWATENFRDSALVEIRKRKDQIPDDFQAFLLETEGDEKKYMQYVGFISPTWVYADALAADGSGIPGATFGIYSDKECSSFICPITTNEDGRARSSSLETGTYYLKQTAAPDGFAADETVYKVVTGQPGVSHIRVKNKSTKAVISKVAQLVDAETGKERPQGAASLAGAEFSVSYWKDEEKVATAKRRSPDLVWKVATDEAGAARLERSSLLAGSGELPSRADGAAFLGPGVISVKMDKAPAGYLFSEQEQTALIAQTDDGCVSRLSTDGDDRIALQVARYDLSIPVRDGAGQPLAGIPFLLTSKTTGEAHVVVSDADGVISTKANRLTDTNANDAAYAGGVIDASKLKAGAGVWFSGSSDEATQPAQDAAGSLPYDAYALAELPLASSTGKALYQGDVDLTGQDAEDVAAAAIINPRQHIAASTTVGGSHVAPPSTGTHLSTTVSYDHLVAGQEYTVVATIHARSADGQDLGAIEGATPQTMTFKPDAAEGSVTLASDVDTSALAGSTLVTFVTLTSADGAASTLEDISDAGLSVGITKLEVTATDKADGDHELDKARGASVGVSAEYANLAPGSTYELVVSAHLKDDDGGDGGLASDASGEPLCARTTWTPDAASGTISVEIPLDIEALSGKDVVLCAQVLQDGKVVALDEGFSSSLNTVHIPSTVTPLPTGVKDVGPSTGGLAASAGALLALGGSTVASSGFARRFMYRRRRH